jgi:hypothetical protein
MQFGALDMMLKLRLEERLQEAQQERLAEQAKKALPRRQLRARVALGLYALATRVEGTPRLAAADA